MYSTNNKEDSVVPAKKPSFLSILQGELDFIPLLRVGIGREKQGEVLDLTNRTDHFITNILAMHYMT